MSHVLFDFEILTLVLVALSDGCTPVYPSRTRNGHVR